MAYSTVVCGRMRVALVLLQRFHTEKRPFASFAAESNCVDRGVLAMLVQSFLSLGRLAACFASEFVVCILLMLMGSFLTAERPTTCPAVERNRAERGIWLVPLLVLAQSCLIAERLAACFAFECFCVSRRVTLMLLKSLLAAERPTTCPAVENDSRHHVDALVD
jgi:hypothetical protein